MKKLLFSLMVTVLFLYGCSQNQATPISTFSAYTATAHVEGEDVYFEYNGVVRVAKGQKEAFEVQTDYTMQIIGMSDGSYLINDTKPNINKPAVAGQQTNNPVKTEEEIAEEQRKLQEEQERIEFLRSKTLHEQQMEEERINLKIEWQEHKIEMEKELLEMQKQNNN